MNNEFIVWDKDNCFGEDNHFHELDRFLDEGLSVHYEKDNGLVIIDYDSDGDYGSPQVLNIETFPYIGKTDDTPEQNKIYADCSIVEYERIIYINDKRFTAKETGVFRYNPLTLRMCIDITLVRKSFIDYDFKTIKNLKVIGTLQEDRHLLGEVMPIKYLTPLTQMRIIKRNSGATAKEIDMLLLRADVKLGMRIINNRAVKILEG